MRALFVSLACTFALGCGSSDDDGGGGGVGGAGAGCPSAGSSPAEMECKVLELVNQERAKGAVCGGESMPPVGPLSMHPALRKSARAHAADMAAKGYFAHDNLEGLSPFDRMTAAGYDWKTAGENIAGGGSTPEKTMVQWMNSPGHCKNVMKGAFQELGVGYAYEESSKLKHYWVQNFGSQ
jgi:uncharacterized protein YkwD